MIHIDDNDIKLEGESIVKIAAELTIALEILGCAGILEYGHKEMGETIINTICEKAKAEIQEPSGAIWKEAKDVMIEIIRRGRNDKG